MNAVAEEGLLSPEMEKAGVLGHDDASKRRPGDVTIPSWSAGKGLAIDVAVICPTNKSNLKVPHPANYYAEVVKHRKYDIGFSGSGYNFVALVIECSGGYGDEAEGLLSQLFRFAAKVDGSRYCDYASKAWARVACNVQQSVAQQILDRS